MSNSSSMAQYRGRFAPSPTGDLHFGSMVAALVSYLQAKANDGLWLLRIEDVDETRKVAGADQLIIETLSRFGMTSDEPILYQTNPSRQEAYQQALEKLNQKQLTFSCVCSRKQLSEHATYPGTCRNKKTSSKELHSIRIKTDQQQFQFNDMFQGTQSQYIAEQSGDFNIKRKDGLFCYQLAVVIDDADQAISEVVRGIDIMDSTSRQMYLIQQLGLAQPSYAHFPIIINSNGDKLSKQNHAKAITHEDPYQLTYQILELLQQNPPQLKQKTQSALLNWAIENWKSDKLYHQTEVSY